MKLWLIAVMLILSSQVAFGGVLEIEEMKVSVFVTEKAHLKYEIKLKNKIDKPIVPGISELRLQKVENPKLLFFSIPIGEYRKAVEVENLKAYSGNLNFKSSTEHFNDYTAIYYEVWYPIEPYGERVVTIEFDANLVDHGLIFKSITIPVGGDVDVRSLDLDISSDWKLCYFEGIVDSVPANHIAFITAEFSILPLPLLPFRGYVLFWGSLMILIAVLALVLVRK
ncbi:MAG: hypothetical protein ACK401_01025 [Archaeoglobaceae archaeon]